MKRISFLLATLTLLAVPGLRAQDAATEERLNKLSGQIDSLLEGQQVLTKSIEKLRKDLETVREEAKQPTGNYASQEDLKRLTDAVNKIDRNRMEDYDKIAEKLRKLGQTIATSTPPTHPASHGKDSGEPTPAPKDQKGFEYEVKSGDTLSAIVQACREKNIKVSMDEILKANPRLKAQNMRVGQKIWIPAS